MNAIIEYQNIWAAIVGVCLGAVVAAIGWHVNRLYRKSDDHEERIADLEADMLTQEDLRHLERQINEDFRHLEGRVERAGDKACENISEVNKRLDSLLQHLAENGK